MKINNDNCIHPLRNLFGGGRAMAASLLVAAIGVLFPVDAQAVFKSELQSRNAGSTNWSGGPVGGWFELDYVPIRSLHTGGPVTNQVITVSFDHSKSAIPGLEDLAGFTASSNVLITAGPTLSAPPGVDIWSYRYTITVTNNQPGTVEFYGRLAAGSHLFAGSSLSLTLGGTLQISKPLVQPGDPDLAISKAGPSAARTNQIITYAIAYTNKWSSPDTAVGVQVSDILPPQVSYVPGSASRGARIVGNTITWDVGNLKPGARGLLTYKVMVTTNLPVTTTFANYAQILSSQDDATPADNISSVTTTVVIVPNPLAMDDFFSMGKNTALTIPAPGVLLNDSNATHGILFSGPVNGTVSFNTNGSFIYTPDTNFVGTDIFAYRAVNVTNTSGPAVVTIEVTNAAPVALNQALTLPEDTATNLVLTATDAEGDPLTFAIVTGPTNGVLSGINPATGEVTYTPNSNFFGTDGFTFRASDGFTNSAIATVNLTITPVNDIPVATGQAVIIPEDTATNLVLTASDLEGGALTYVIATGPANGSLSGFNPFTGTVTYTPDLDFNGADSFTFFASDGVNSSAAATVTITILPVNDNPVAVADVASTTKNASLTLFVLDNDYDVDGDPLTITTASATNGVVAIVGGTNLFFTPASNFVGYATIAYSIADGQGGFASAPGSVTIAVGTNAPPVAVADHLATPEDTELTFDPRSNDYDLDADPIIISSIWPTNGTATLLGGTNLVFVPATNFTGVATIGYSIADTNGGIGSAVIYITVSPLNDSPVVVDDLVTMNEDSTNTIPVLANDSDPDGDWLTIVSINTTNGAASVLGTNVVYAPSPDFYGTNTLTYCATDGTVTNCAAITVVVLPVNDAPVANNQSVTISEDTSTNLVLTATDADSSGLVYAALVGPTNGGLSVLNTNSGALTYTPNANYVGSDSFTFTVFDGELYATGTVSVVITPVQDAPIAVDDFTTTPEDTAVSIPVLANDSDPDGDPLTIVSVSTPNGTATVVGTNVLYTPGLNFEGTNVMTYTISDGQGGTNSAFIRVGIAPPVNDAPVANNQSVTISEDTSTNLVLTATDVDSSGLVYATLVGPTNGGLSLLDTNSGALTYTPNANYVGSDSFTFTVFDGELYATGTVSIAVLPVNDAPVLALVIPDLAGIYGSPFGYTFPAGTFTDVDPGTTLTYTASNLPPGITFDGPTRTFSGTPTMAGLFAVTVIATDDGAPQLSASDSFNFTVAPASLTVAAANQTRAYGVANPPFTYVLSGLVLGDTTNVVSGAPKLGTSASLSSPVGTYAITVGLGTLTATNYTFTLVDGTLTVTNASLNLTWTPDSPVVYGTALGSNQLNAVASVPGKFDYDPTNGVVLNAGTNILGVVFTPTDTNYTPALLTVPLVVLPATIEVAALNIVRAYRQPNPLLTFLLSGFVNGENASIVAGQPMLNTTATMTSPVGAYPISVGTGALVTSNYIFAFTPGTLIITNAAPVVDWTPVGPIIYGTPLGTNQLNATSSEPGTYNYTPTNGTVLNAGTNLLQLSFNPADTNYTAVNLFIPLEVLPATLGVRADDQTRIYNQINPPLTFTYAGFVNGEDASVITGQPLVSTPATVTSPVGLYPIEVALGTLASGNYTFALTNGTLTVVHGFGFKPGANVFNPQTGLYEQTVIVTNTIGSTVAALQLLVGHFASTNGTPRTNVWLWNAAGTNFDGRRYVQYNSPLNPGQTVALKLEFYNPTRVAFTNSLEVQATLPAPSTNLTGGVVIDRAFTDLRLAGEPRFVIEWVSIIGRSYTAIYSEDLISWTPATPSVTATSTRTQWYDDGPPKTASKPLGLNPRYYRVILNP